MFIPVRGFAKAMVEMGDGYFQPPIQINQEMQKRDGIRASGTSRHYLFLRGQEVMPLDGLFNSRKKHMGIITDLRSQILNVKAIRLKRTINDTCA